MNWIDKLEKRFGGLAVPNLALYLIVGQVFVFAGIHFGRIDINLLYLNIPSILNGQVWRIFSFLFIPPATFSPIFLAFAWYIFWMISQALESQWGAFKYNLFIFLAVVFTVLASILFPGIYFTNNYISLTVFFAFATLYPNFEFMLFFVLPVKVKWLAYISVGFLVLSFIGGSWPARVVILVSLGNYALFFGKDLYSQMKNRKRRIEHHKKVDALAEEAFHTCKTCGATDKSTPEREFRYRDGDGICSVCVEKEAASESSPAQ
jgi:hypothetical protein